MQATTPKPHSEYPQVLIVGAGPTGLTLAIDLARRNISCRIIDRMTSRSDKSRALVIHARSMELLNLMDTAGGFRDAQRGTELESYVLGKRAASVKLADDLGAQDSRFPYMTFVSQAVTERVLETKLNALGVHVEYNVELTGLIQTDTEVHATLRTAGGVEEVCCGYIVGCDGAHSKVRHALELTFEGAPYPQTFLLADVRVDWNLPHNKLMLFFGHRGLFAFFPLDGERMSRLILMAPERTKDSDKDPTLEEMEAFARAYTRRDVKLSNPAWLSRFRLHHRGVGAYRQGRAFVAGDAAHIHSPAGGQGMNTGIQDAMNLGWKLAWAIDHKLSGEAAHTLLDSYHVERFPVGRKLLNTTDQIFRVAATGSYLVATLRNIIVPLLMPFAQGSAAIRFRMFRFVSQLGIRYRTSTLNVTARQNSVKHAQVGDRAPDIDLGLNHWLYDDFKHGGMTWLAIATGDAQMASIKQELAHALTLNGMDTWPVTYLIGNAVTSRYAVKDRALFLVRPDTHILMRLDGSDVTAASLNAAIRRGPWIHS